MKMENRLDQAREYLKEALKDPDHNKLYIADLKLSIPLFELQANQAVSIMEGFEA